MTVTTVAFGEEIRAFIVEVYEKFTRFYVNGDNYRKGDLEEVYTFSWVPDGYVLTDYDTEGPVSVIAWENGESFIELKQAQEK